MGISFNNDEKKRFEIALNQMLNNSLFGFVVFKDDKIVFVNKNASKLIGYSREEILKFQKDDLSKMNVLRRIISPFIRKIFLFLLNNLENMNHSIHNRINFYYALLTKKIKLFG